MLGAAGADDGSWAVLVRVAQPDALEGTLKERDPLGVSVSQPHDMDGGGAVRRGSGLPPLDGCRLGFAQGEDEPVAQSGDDERHEGVEDPVGLQGLGEAGGGLGQELQALVGGDLRLSGLPPLDLADPPLAGVVERHGQTLRPGKGTYLIPFPLFPQVGVERGRLTGLNGALVVRAEDRLDRQGEFVPHHLAQQVGPVVLQHAFGLPVHIREAPIGSEREEGVAHVLEYPQDPVAAGRFFAVDRPRRVGVLIRRIG